MKKYLLTGFFFSSCIMMAAAQTFTAKDFQALHAWTGLWKMETSHGPMYEEWCIENKQKLSGKMFRMHNTDTIVLERTELLLLDSAIIYSPAVVNQNNGQAVHFRLISCDHNRYIFENKEHDFPQRIIYNLVSSDSLHARIEGTVKKMKRVSSFWYRRVQCIEPQKREDAKLH